MNIICAITKLKVGFRVGFWPHYYREIVNFITAKVFILGNIR